MTSQRLRGLAETEKRQSPQRRPPQSALLAAAGASAVLLSLATPPLDLGWLGWPALIPYFWALLQYAGGESRADAPPRRRSPWWPGFCHGFLLLMLTVPWFGAFSPAGYPVAGVYWGLLSGIIAVLSVSALRRAPRAAAPAVLAAGWTLLEWLRAQGTLAFPWGSLAATQHKNLPILQVLDLCGAFGLSFLMALCAASLALLLVERGETPRPSAALRWVAALAGLLVLCLGRGFWLLSRAPRPSETANIGVVQQSESRKTEGAAVRCYSPTIDYDRATLEVIRAGAELVVWPEAARPNDVANDPLSRQEVENLVKGQGAYLLAGSFILDPKQREYTNGAAMFTPQGVLSGRYAKVLIVPFGEYLPARPLLAWTERLGMPATDLVRGSGWTPLPWAKGSVGVSICFESAFGYVSRAHVLKGANLLAIMTSDGWAGRTAAGLQHAAFAPLRAVENRRSVARAAATGVSQLIDPYGRVLQSLPMFNKGSAVTALPLRTDLTLYTRLGDWPVPLAALLLLFPFAAARFRRSR